MIFTIRPYDVEYHWPILAPLIARVLPLDPNPPSLDEVKERLGAGKLCCVVVFDETEQKVVALATMFINDRQEVVGEHLAGAEVEAWVAELSAAIDDFARLNGCKVIRSFARKGWTPIARKFGYVDAGVTLFTKRLDD